MLCAFAPSGYPARALSAPAHKQGIVLCFEFGFDPATRKLWGMKLAERKQWEIKVAEHAGVCHAHRNPDVTYMVAPKPATPEQEAALFRTLFMQARSGASGLFRTLVTQGGRETLACGRGGLLCRRARLLRRVGWGLLCRRGGCVAGKGRRGGGVGVKAPSECGRAQVRRVNCGKSSLPENTVVTTDWLQECMDASAFIEPQPRCALGSALGLALPAARAPRSPSLAL